MGGTGEKGNAMLDLDFGRAPLFPPSRRLAVRVRQADS